MYAPPKTQRRRSEESGEVLSVSGEKMVMVGDANCSPRPGMLKNPYDTKDIDGATGLDLTEFMGRWTWTWKGYHVWENGPHQLKLLDPKNRVSTITRHDWKFQKRYRVASWGRRTTTNAAALRRS